MKEFEPSRLTNRTPQLTLKGERGFMSESSAPTETAERPAVEATVPHLRRAAARRETERDVSPAAIYERIIERELEKGGISEEAARELIVFKSSLGGEGRESQIVDDIQRTRDPELRKQKIKEHLKVISPHQPQDPNFLKLVTEHDDTLDYFVNRIVTQPWDAETSEYRLSFYGSINLEFIRDILRTASEGDRSQREKYTRIYEITSAASLFHEMNRTIVMGQLDGFVRAAPAITPQQLQTLKDIPGVAQVMRLFDEEYNRLLAKDDYIKDTENYAEMMGIKKDKETGEILVTGGSIEEKLKELVNAEKASGLDLGGSLGKLEEWQIIRAFQAGKILNNISLRAAEQISLGKPMLGDDEAYASWPQEAASAALNWMLKKGLRFDIAEVRGGVKLAQMVRSIYQRDREKQGYGKLNITKITGKDIKAFEDAGLFANTGIWSSWRQNVILLENAPICAVEGFGENTLKGHMDYKDRLKRDMKSRLEKENETRRPPLSEEAIDTQVAKYIHANEHKILEKIFLDEKSGSLRQEINAYLGVLLKHGSVTPKRTDTPETIAMKQKIREEIWKRASEENPLGVAPFLSGVKGKLSDGFVDLTAELKAEGGVWDSLRGKLRKAHEARLVAIRRREEDTSLDRFIRENGKKAESLRLTPAEQLFLGQIRSNGKLLSVEFAKLRFPFNPFMNDVIFENAEYGEAGAEFFRRKMASDFPALFKASETFVKLMDNPGVHSLEEITNILHEMVEAIGVPLSIETGQDRVAPFAEAMLEFISAGSHIEKPASLKIFGREIPFPLPLGLLKWVANDELTKFISNNTNRANSMAQIVAGTKALSLNERGRLEALDLWLHKGVLRRGFIKNGVLAAVDLYDEFRKKFKTGLGWLILAFIRTIIPAFALGAFVETGKRTYQGK